MPLCVPLVHTTCQLLLTLSRAVNAAFLVIAGGAKAIKGTGCVGYRTKSGETIQTSGSRHTNSPCPSPAIGTAHFCTPVTNAQFVCRLLLEIKTTFRSYTSIIN